MPTFITLASAVLASTGFSTIIVACLNRKWQKEDNRTVTKDDLKCITDQLNVLTDNQKIIAVDRIRHLVKANIAQGYVDIEDKESIVEMHKSYKKLGGNGHLDTIMKELEKLPVKDGKL